MKLSSLLLLAVALPAAAQYQITSWTVDGGGGTSAGGVYSLSGTIGQPDAGVQTGGAYTLIGGFWSQATTLQMEDAPLLRITRANTQIILSWPSASAGFQLELSPSLVAPTWSDVNTAPVIVGAEKQVTLSLEPGMRFFRLRKP